MQWFSNFFGSRRTVKHNNFLAHFVYKIINILINLYLVSEENPNSHKYDAENCIKMEKAKIFAAHLVTSCGAPFQNHWPNVLGTIPLKLD
jgi:hypothetical protein